MDKKISGLIGAISALVALNGTQAQASTTPNQLRIQAYADLLQPIPNAVALLAVSDAQLDASPADRNIVVADHHHHHRYRRHHHHHHHRFYRG